jgi:hypothetical protein
LTWYADTDGDTYGDPAVTTPACTLPADYVADAEDCDDSDPDTNPGALEYCGGADENCDGATDEDSAADASTWYEDADSDGFGAPDSTRVQCTQPTGYLADATDCLDTDLSVNPDGTEVCDDQLDNDCDGTQNGCVFSSPVLSSSADAIFTGEAANNNAGSAVAAAGDVNGDGIDDVLVGAEFSRGGSSGFKRGRAYLVHGSVSGTRALSTADAIFSGAVNSNYTGNALTGAGDVDGDGYDDMLIGAYGRANSSGASNAGAAHLLFGPQSGSVTLTGVGTTFEGVAATDYAGYSVGRTDLDADGLSDLLIGANRADTGGTDGGAVYVFYGGAQSDFSTTVSLSGAAATLVGAAGDQTGRYLSGSGDVDGDGFGDILAGAHANDSDGTDAGLAYLALGPLSGLVTLSTSATATWTGVSASDYAGWSVAIVGDTNADGYDDALIGANQADSVASNSGAAYLVLGSATPASGSLSGAAARLDGLLVGDKVGQSVAGAGDVNGDGMADLLVGSDLVNASGLRDNGATYLVHGPVSGIVLLSAASATFQGSAIDQSFATSINGAGDVNNDGQADILVGATGYGTGGGAFLFNGIGY